MEKCIRDFGSIIQIAQGSHFQILNFTSKCDQINWLLKGEKLKFSKYWEFLPLPTHLVPVLLSKPVLPLSLPCPVPESNWKKETSLDLYWQCLITTQWTQSRRQGVMGTLCGRQQFWRCPKLFTGRRGQDCCWNLNMHSAVGSVKFSDVSNVSNNEIPHHYTDDIWWWGKYD